MKKKLGWLPGLALACMLNSGCGHMNNTERGALGGGVVGAAAGTVIGGLAGDPGAGAAIGAGVGALTGGALGNQQDKQERQAIEQAAYAAQHPPLPLDQVVFLAHNHTSPAIIKQQIDSTGSTYNLTPEQLVYLKQQGVAEEVIIHMQSRRPGTVVVAPRRPDVVIVEPAPPPVSVGFGFGFGGPRCGPGWRHRGCW